MRARAVPTLLAFPFPSLINLASSRLIIAPSSLGEARERNGKRGSGLRRTWETVERSSRKLSRHHRLDEEKKDGSRWITSVCFTSLRRLSYQGHECRLKNNTHLQSPSRLSQLTPLSSSAPFLPICREGQHCQRGQQASDDVEQCRTTTVSRQDGPRNNAPYRRSSFLSSPLRRQSQRPLSSSGEGTLSVS
jgi:hypothetical protein